MKISLVVPVRNEARSLGKLLETISAQTRLPDEVIFVDAGSTDDTKEIIGGYKDDRIELKVVSIGPAYPGVARNAGVKAARYEFIAFTDGGIELDRDWLRELASLMEKKSALDIVYGGYAPKTDTLFKECLALAVVPPRAFLGGGLMRSRFIASTLLKRSAWGAVGGFKDLRAAEDKIFMEDIEKKGFKFTHNPRALVVWDIPPDLKGVFRRFCDYSYHDLKAVRSRTWHAPVLKMYIAALIFVLLGVFVTPVFIFLVLGAFALRVIRKISVNRNEPYFSLRHVPEYVFLTAFLVIFIDMAMFAGWIRYLIKG